MKGGGWGWPYCPLNLPNMPAIKDEPPVFCYQEPQGAGQLSGHKFYYLACLSARFMPVRNFCSYFFLFYFFFFLLFFFFFFAALPSGPNNNIGVMLLLTFGSMGMLD